MYFFVGTLIPLFWTSGDVSSGFQSKSGQLYSCLAETYELHVPWDFLLVWHLPTSWQPAWQLSWSLPHTCEQALLGLETRTYGFVDECSINWAMPALLTIAIVEWVQSVIAKRIHFYSFSSMQNHPYNLSLKKYTIRFYLSTVLQFRY